MTDVVGICRLALSHIGHKSTITSIDSPYESREAELCAQFYPISRQLALATDRPAYAIKRAALADVSLAVELPEQWQFAYTKPANALTIIGVYEPGRLYDEDDKGYLFEVSDIDTDVLYSNVEDATAKFVVDVTNTDKFSPQFVMGLSWLLGSFLSGPLIKGDVGMGVAEKCRGMAAGFFSVASAHDANQQNVADIFADYRHLPSWIEARGIPGIVGDARIIRGDDA